MLLSVARVLIFGWLALWTAAEYLRDEDVHLQIYSPPDGKNAIALELIIYNRDEEFFVTIRSEEGKMICQGQFSRFSADRVKCSYDTAILKDGDNSFHVTIRAVATNELVLDTISHFFYDSNRVVEANLLDDASENWDILIALVMMLLLYQLGKLSYKKISSMLTHSSTDSGPPPPPPPSLPIPVTLDDFKVDQVDPVSPLTPIQQNVFPLEAFLNNNMHIIRAALIGAAILLSGRVILGPRRVIAEPVRISYQSAPSPQLRYSSSYPIPVTDASGIPTQSPAELKFASEHSSPTVHIQARDETKNDVLGQQPRQLPMGTSRTRMDSRLEGILQRLSDSGGENADSEVEGVMLGEGNGRENIGEAQWRSVYVPSLPTRRYRWKGIKRANG